MGALLGVISIHLFYILVKAEAETEAAGTTGEKMVTKEE
jgi:hypothetical protein